MPYIRGYEEDGFVKQLDVTRQELEIIVPDKVFDIIELHEILCIATTTSLGTLLLTGDRCSEVTLCYTH